MHRPASLRRASRAGFLTFVALAFAACSAETPVAPDGGAPQFARGGNGGGGGGGSEPTPSVNAANPESLPRGSVAMVVEVVGSGFTPDSDVSFELDGASTEAVLATSVTFVDESHLVATVDVSLEALEVSYDIAVRNGPKKKGVGIDLLRVTEPTPAYPVIQGVELTGLDGDVSLSDVSGNRITGHLEGGCGFVYDIDAATLDCLAIPGTAPDQVYPLGLNAAGVVVGTAYDAVTNEPRYFLLDFAVDPSAVTYLGAPSGWDILSLGYANPINAQGQVAGIVDRIIQGRGKHQRTREFALVLWNSDGSVAAVSSAFDLNPYAEGLSDVQPDGRTYVGARTGVWNGVDGTAPVGDQGPLLMTPEGIAYSIDGNRIVAHSAPTWVGGSAITLDVPGFQSIQRLQDDENGNLLVGTRVGGNAWGPNLCVARDGSGIAELGPVFSSQWLVHGSGGKVFGLGREDETAVTRPTVWDLSTISDGCSTGP